MEAGVLIAYPTLALTIGLAVFRPRIGLGGFRFSPGSAALLGVTLLIATGILIPEDLVRSAHMQWRPLLALTCIMIMTGLVQEAGVFDRLAVWIEARARRRSATHAFTIVFVLSVVTPSLLNNDAAILILTPLVVAMVRRLYPGDPKLVVAFAFAVFLAPGVAPFIVSNPMNMIVAEFAGLDFNAYAEVMLPISAVGALLTYVILRIVYRKALQSARLGIAQPAASQQRQPGQAAAIVLLLAVFLAYPVGASLGAKIWSVAVLGACGALVLTRTYRIAPVRTVASHVSIDILVFLWGIFLVVEGLNSVGVVDLLASLYASAPTEAGHIFTIGATSAIGSALVDNHPMSILNMAAIDSTADAKPLLAALVGGDIGPRLLPIGSLAGLLWMDLLRRSGVEVGGWQFFRLGTIILIPTLTISLVMLWMA